MLEKVVARQPAAAGLAEARLRITFRAVLGEELASYCEEITVRGTTVSVTTANPALAHQLRLDADTLVLRLNAESRLARQVREVRVRVGRPGPAPG